MTSSGEKGFVKVVNYFTSLMFELGTLISVFNYYVRSCSWMQPEQIVQIHREPQSYR